MNDHAHIIIDSLLLKYTIFTNILNSVKSIRPIAKYIQIYMILTFILQEKPWQAYKLIAGYVKLV